MGISHGKRQQEGPRRMLEDKLMLKLIPEKYFVRIWAALNWLRTGPNDGLWWCGNELLGSMKARLT
jgi:hypothetical protein